MAFSHGEIENAPVDAWMICGIEVGCPSSVETNENGGDESGKGRSPSAPADRGSQATPNRARDFRIRGISCRARSVRRETVRAAGGGSPMTSFRVFREPG
jgi:hypothetical protein